MKKDYEMITLKEYVSNVENVVDLNEEAIKAKVTKYLLDMKRHSTNEKIIEAMLG